MVLALSLLAALVGLALAAAAAFLPDTGINGTVGAFLALLGAGSVALALGIFLSASVSSRLRGVLGFLIVVSASLTATAAWFLMQDWLLGAMVLSILAFLVNGIGQQGKRVT